MHRALRVAGYIAGALAVVFVIGSATAFTVSSRKMSETFDVRLTTVHVPDDAESMAWGGHLVNAVAGCRDCHGPDLAGSIMGDDGVARMVAPNLTRGRGGLANDMTEQDWVRAIRHGVRRDGRSLIIMPSYSYAHLSDRDLGAMIAYLRQIPAVDNELPSFHLRPLGRALVAAGVFDNEFVAKKVPQRDSYDTVEPAISLEYGEYLATISGCNSCHRPDLKGGPSGAPGAPPAADISATALAAWTLDDLRRALREGRRPDGSAISEYMPWKYFAEMTDEEIEAIWTYIRTVQ
jgi:mono/diheme cytochrome c family protein